MKLKGRVIGDDAAAPKMGCCEKAVDRPFVGIGMLGNRRKNASRNALDVAGLKMLGEHGGYHLVVGLAPDSHSIFGPAKDRPGAEERG